MPASQKTQKHIWGQFAARCAICREKLIEVAEKSTSLVGEVAHIVGEKSGAPRGNSQLTLAERNDAENLLLLCLKHHKIIDDDESGYPTQRLHQIRVDFLAWLEGQLSSAQRWNDGIQQYCYLNVPRLDEFANLSGFTVQHPEIPEGQNLRSFGYELNAIMASYRRTLERIAIDAVPVNGISFAHEGYVGQLISFDRLRVRTRNMPLYRPHGSYTFSGNPESDPHIYHQFPGWRLILTVNPRWVTTDTAYCMFRPSGGASTFSGFARINHVDYETKTMTATGLAIGIPDSIFNSEPRRGAVAEMPPHTRLALAALEDDVSTGRESYWYPEPEACDLCARQFSTQLYMIDGAMTQPKGYWACMCEDCFASNGRGLGIGVGQLYRKMAEGWRLVGGYPEHEKSEGE
jgi:hypothetical protein